MAVRRIKSGQFKDIVVPSEDGAPVKTSPQKRTVRKYGRPSNETW
jgi:hypothetical protein